MPINSRSVLTTVSDIMSFMADYAGDNVPVSGDEDFSRWLRWIQLGQQDAANRGFWRRLLTKTSLNIVANQETTNLPDNFYKINGIWALFVNGVDWSQRNNKDNVTIFVETNPQTAVWRVRWLPKPPTQNATGDLWYFFNPPRPTAITDVVFLDGEMIGFYALKEYFRRLKQLGSMDDARIEYENRLREHLSFEMLPSSQEMLSFGSYSSFRNISSDESRFYTGRLGRARSV